eukprot:scaffold276506_cov32-Tisochrysis_lutea.AAC.2
MFLAHLRTRAQKAANPQPQRSLWAHEASARAHDPFCSLYMCTRAAHLLVSTTIAVGGWLSAWSSSSGIPSFRSASSESPKTPTTIPGRSIASRYSGCRASAMTAVPPLAVAGAGASLQLARLVPSDPPLRALRVGKTKGSAVSSIIRLGRSPPFEK